MAEPEYYKNMIDLIDEELDRMGIPRATAIGAEYSTYGRVCLLSERVAQQTPAQEGNE